MTRETLEQDRHWRATVEYHSNQGLQIVCLLCDGLMDCGHYWFIADYFGAALWEAVRPYDAVATQHMIQAGKCACSRGGGRLP